MAAKSCQYGVWPGVPRPASSLINRNLQAVGIALSLKKMYLGFTAQALAVQLCHHTQRPKSLSELASQCRPVGFWSRFPEALRVENESQAPVDRAPLAFGAWTNFYLQWKAKNGEPATAQKTNSYSESLTTTTKKLGLFHVIPPFEQKVLLSPFGESPP